VADAEVDSKQQHNKEDGLYISVDRSNQLAGNASTRSTAQISHAWTCCLTLRRLQLLCFAAVGEETQEAEATGDAQTFARPLVALSCCAWLQ